MSGMIQDSLALRGAVHWYTTMVVRRAVVVRACCGLLELVQEMGALTGTHPWW